MLAKSKINLLWIYLLLVAIGVPVSDLHAGRTEENFLSLQPAESAAKRKDFDHFFRIIVWPGFPPKLPFIAVEIYFSYQTATSPGRGYASVKVRTPDAKFWEHSRELNEKEVEKICDLLETEEIFSLPAKRWSFSTIPPLKMGANPEGYFFTHIDNIQHTKQEIERGVSASHPAQRVAGGISEILKDLIDQIEKESGWADYVHGK